MYLSFILLVSLKKSLQLTNIWISEGSLYMIGHKYRLFCKSLLYIHNGWWWCLKHRNMFRKLKSVVVFLKIIVSFALTRPLGKKLLKGKIDTIKRGWKHFHSLLILHFKFQFSKSIKSSIFHISLNLTLPLRKKYLFPKMSKSHPKIYTKQPKRWLWE